MFLKVLWETLQRWQPPKIENLETLYFALHSLPQYLNSLTNATTPPPPPTNWPSCHGLRHSWSMLSKFPFIIVMKKQSLSVTQYVQKWPRNCTMNEKSSNFEGGNGLNFKLKHRNAGAGVSSRVPLARVLFTISPKWRACSQASAVSGSFPDNPGELA